MSNQGIAEFIQVGEQTIASEEVMPLLIGYGMLPQFLREVLIDSTISKVSCTPEEIILAQKQFAKKHQLNTETMLQTWLERYGMTTEQLVALAVRELKIEKFKYATWESKLESYFLTHKSKLDRVVYSLLRTTEQELTTELYFRIESGEQTFSELARQYSAGPEAQTGGLIGPIELSKPNPTLAKMLSISQPGQLWSPIQLDEWFVILRLEKFIPAVLDEAMRQQLLNSLFESWIQEQVQQEIGGMDKGQKVKENYQPLTNSKTIQRAVSEVL